MLDSVLGVATGWLWESVFAQAAVKKKVRQIEHIIEEWNMQLDKEARLGGRTSGGEERTDVACCIPLRRTGFMSLDIQIPDPMVSIDGRLEGSGTQGAVEEKHG